jgi:hypothetical protein
MRTQMNATRAIAAKHLPLPVPIASSDDQPNANVRPAVSTTNECVAAADKARGV